MEKNKKYICKVCGEKFKNEFELIIDLQRHYKNTYFTMKTAEEQLDKLNVKCALVYD